MLIKEFAVTDRDSVCVCVGSGTGVCDTEGLAGDTTWRGSA